VFFDILILPGRAVDGVVTPSAGTKVSLQKKEKRLSECVRQPH